MQEKGIYFIENTVDELRTKTTGFFETLDAAKEALAYCADWFREQGTGTIYFAPFGLNKPKIKVYSV